MILDSSAIIAILLAEPGAHGLIERLGSGSALGIGAPTAVETCLVARRRLGPSGHAHVVGLLQRAGVEILPFGEPHWLEAVAAFERFGKGRHPASLNFGDCLSYAAARVAGAPLLCVGDDFPKTDLPIDQGSGTLSR